MWSNRRSDAP